MCTVCYVQILNVKCFACCTLHLDTHRHTHQTHTDQLFIYDVPMFNTIISHQKCVLETKMAGENVWNRSNRLWFCFPNIFLNYWSSEGRSFVMRSLNPCPENFDQNIVVCRTWGKEGGSNRIFFSTKNTFYSLFSSFLFSFSLPFPLPFFPHSCLPSFSLFCQKLVIFFPDIFSA